MSWSRRSASRALIATLVTFVTIGTSSVVNAAWSLAAAPVAAVGERVVASPQDGPVTVEATGRGESPKEARKEAIVAALRQIVGEYVEADVVIANDEVVKNEILSFSNAGGVKSEQVGQPRFVEGDLVEVTMRVTVEPKPLVARVKGAAKAGARLDGAALAAEIAAAKDDYEAKKRVLDKAFANLPASIMTVKVLDADGSPSEGLDRRLVDREAGPGRVALNVPVRLAFDETAWNDSVRRSLGQVLEAASDRASQSSLTLRGTSAVALSWTADGSDGSRGTSAGSAVGGRLSTGDGAPSLRSGERISGPLAELPRGRVGVVLFWATWCGLSRKSLPRIAELHERYASDGVSVIAVSNEKPEAIRSFVDRQAGTLPFSFVCDRDGGITRSWCKAAGRNGTPCVFLVSRDGRVAWIGHPGDPAFVEQLERLRDDRSSATAGPASGGDAVDVQSASRRFDLPSAADGSAGVALLRDVLQGGRQLVFDEYRLDPTLLPWSRTGLRGAVPPMVLRLRLLDADGGVVDGVDLDLIEATPAGIRFGWSSGYSGGSSGGPSPLPFFAEARKVWFSDRAAEGAENTTLVAPLWWWGDVASSSIDTEVRLTIDLEDLDRIALVELELAVP